MTSILSIKRWPADMTRSHLKLALDENAHIWPFKRKYIYCVRVLSATLLTSARLTSENSLN